MKISAKSNFFYLFFGCMILFVLFSPSSAFAEDNGEWDVKLSNTPYSIQQEDGSILFFDNESDYNSYLDEQNKPQLRCATCNQTTQTLVDKETKYQQFINYHPATPYWTYASNYSLSVSDTFSVTGSIQWKNTTVSINVARTVGAVANIPANASKQSRLGVYSDLSLSRYYNVTKNPIGQVINSYYSNYATPIGDPLVQVTYK